MSSRTRTRPLPATPNNGQPDGSVWGQDAVSTGSLALDLKLGTGGWPRGRIVEIYGAEGSGKTTLLLEAIAQVQQGGGLGAFIDADHATDQRRAARLGIDLERMPFVQTNILEEAFEKIEELALGGAVDVIALDSIAALLPKDSRTCQDVPFHQSERHQYQVEHYLKALLGPLARSRAVLLITNQVRIKVGVVYGSPETTPWITLPLRDFASVRVNLTRTGLIKNGDEAVGAQIKAKIVKNRLAAPMTQAEFELHFASGICAEADLVALGFEAGLLSKRGGRLYFGDVMVGMGNGGAARYLRDNGDLAAQLRAGIVERLGPPAEPVPEGDAGAEAAGP
jgi:recombination protein RecA